MEIEEIKQKFNKALSEFLTGERYLLEKDVSERAITHKLADYIQVEFPDANVDCEYNRNGKKPKYIQYDFNKALQTEVKKIIDRANKELDKLNIPESEYDDVNFLIPPFSTYPDIIVHKRGENFPHNLLVIEVKKSNPDSDEEAFDLAKLKAFTSKDGDGELNKYHYFLGVYLTVYCGEESNTIPKVKYFKDGRSAICA